VGGSTTGTVNVAVLVSLGTFVVSVTVYTVPGDALVATVKPELDRAPAEIVHACEAEEKRPAGDEVSVHEVPAKLEAEAVTTVPAGPEVGVNVRLGAMGALNDAMATSPVEPVIVTKYAPLAPGATVNDPDATPPVTVQTGFEIRVGEEGDDVIAQLVSPEAREPETRTEVPAAPVIGLSESPPVLTKVGVAVTVPSELGKVNVYDPGEAPLATVKLPVIWKVDAEMLQDKLDNSPVGELDSEAQPAAASAALNPEPVMETDVEDGPVDGVSVILGVTVNAPVPKRRWLPPSGAWPKVACLWWLGCLAASHRWMSAWCKTTN
jgi:hypothetical protein